MSFRYSNEYCLSWLRSSHQFSLNNYLLGGSHQIPVDQQDVANEQIKQLTMVTKQAQSLNLADKSPEQIKMLKGDAETSNEHQNEDKKKDDSSNESSKKHWWHWW